jgi:hypothetical protein
MSTFSDAMNNRKSRYSTSQVLKRRNGKSIRAFADHTKEAFISSIAGDSVAGARVLRHLRDAVRTADPPPPGDGMNRVLETLADLATNSSYFFVRRAALQAMAAHTEYIDLHQLVMDAEMRLVEDDMRMNALRGCDARDLPAHHLRLLKMSTSNEPKPNIRGLSFTARTTLREELANIKQNIATMQVSSFVRASSSNFGSH